MASTLKEAVLDPLDMTVGTPEGKIDLVYSRYGTLLTAKPVSPWDTGAPEPLKADALNVIAKLKGAAAGETKKATALQADRGTALTQIESWVNSTVGISCKAFPHINPFRFAIELALRVRRPRSINQRATVLCGAAGILSAYFKTDPKRATQFALDLVDDGVGMLRSYRIEPQGRVRNDPPPAHFKMAPVDWVLLASLRYHFEPLAELVGLFSTAEADPLRQLTKPGLLYATLVNMGYTTVADRTFGLDTFSATTKLASAITRYGMHAQSEATRGSANLALAAQDVLAGRLVFLWAYGELTDYSRSAKKANPFPAPKGVPQQEFDGIGFPKLHWTLVRKLVVSKTDVKIRHYSWGKARDATFSMDDFLGVYQGHVMADPA